MQVTLREANTKEIEVDVQRKSPTTEGAKGRIGILVGGTVMHNTYTQDHKQDDPDQARGMVLTLEKGAQHQTSAADGIAHIDEGIGRSNQS